MRHLIREFCCCSVSQLDQIVRLRGDTARFDNRRWSLPGQLVVDAGGNDWHGYHRKRAIRLLGAVARELGAGRQPDTCGMAKRFDRR